MNRRGFLRGIVSAALAGALNPVVRAYSPDAAAATTALLQQIRKPFEVMLCAPLPEGGAVFIGLVVDKLNESLERMAPGVDLPTKVIELRTIRDGWTAKVRGVEIA